MKFGVNRTFVALFILLVISFPALKSLTANGFYTSHDGTTHIVRIAQYYAALKDGQIPPRFAPSLYSGLGSPIFVYIYPLPYLLGAALHSIGFSFVDSFKVLMATGFVLSAIFSYLWLKELFHSEKAAFLGALFYVWSPYRFLLIYVRASLSEHLAYTFLPLFLYAVTKLSKSISSLWVGFSAIAFAAVLLSQNLVALLNAPLLIFYMLGLVYAGKSTKFLVYALVSVTLGLAISAITYLPSLLERKYVLLDSLIKDQFVHHFVGWWQLIRSPWGYGFDLVGTKNDALSLQIGLAHIMVLALALIGFIYLRLKKANNQKKINTILLSFLAIYAISVFMMLDWSATKFIWQNITPLQIIDIPWRLLGTLMVIGAFLAAYVAKNIKPGIIFILLVATPLVANRNHLRINKPIYYYDSFFLNYADTATQYGEFTTIWRAIPSAPKVELPTSQIIWGHGQINVINVTSKKIVEEVQVDSDRLYIMINKMYFPGIQVKKDNVTLIPFRELIIPTEQFTYLKEARGTMIVPLQAGTHRIETSFDETKLRIFANWLSSISLIFALILMFLKRHA